MMNRFHCILGDLLASPKVSLYFYQQDGRKFTRGRTEPILGLKQRLRQSLLPCNRSCLAHRTRSKLTWPCLSVIQTNAAEIVYYTSPEAADVTNAIFLLGSFLVAHLGATPEQAWSPFAHLSGAVPLPRRNLVSLPVRPACQRLLQGARKGSAHKPLLPRLLRRGRVLLLRPPIQRRHARSRQGKVLCL